MSNQSAKRANRNAPSGGSGAQPRDPGANRRLTDQLAAYQKALALKAKVKKLHVVARDLDDIAFYPAHDQRKESAEYTKVHHELIVTADLPCMICGVKNTTLREPHENPYGAKQLETHHCVIEWSLANAVDPAKFNKIVRPGLKHRHPDNATYSRDMNAKEIAAWVDHSPDNLWVLCDVHHRAKFFGIHEVSYPIWGPQEILKDDFEGFVRTALGTRGGKALG